MARQTSGPGGGGSSDSDDPDSFIDEDTRTGDRPTGIAGPDDTPGGGGGGDGSDVVMGAGGTSPAGGGDVTRRRTSRRRARDVSGGGGGSGDTPTRSRGGGGGGMTRAERASLTADFAGAFRAVRADPGRGGRRPVAGGRQAARAVAATPGGPPVDPVAEVDRVSESLEEAFISRDPTTAREFGADVEGFDEVGSGPFDLPDDFGGRTQERLQENIADRLAFTDPIAEGAEDVRQDILGRVGIGTGGGLATAAAAGVVAPEPATTIGGAAVLGGLAVGGIAFDVARRRGIIEIPEDGELFGGPEFEPGETTAGETRLIIPDETTVGEIPVPESGAGLERPEVPVPDQPVGAGGEIGIPEVAASQFAQGVRQRQRQERRRERGIFQRERPGASDEELEEILRGPDEDVLLGEETPPGEEVAEETGREFFGERDIDPRVVVPEETTGGINQLVDEATTQELDASVGFGSGTVESPLIVFGQEQRPDVGAGVGTGPSIDVGQDTAQIQDPVEVPDVAPDVDRLDQPPAQATPTDPGVAEPTAPVFEETPADPGFGEPGTRGFDSLERDTLTDIPEPVGGDRRDRRRDEFERLFSFPVADTEAVLGGGGGGFLEEDDLLDEDLGGGGL